MKLHKSQTGFTAIHSLLFLVIIGIISFAGWKVYSTGKSSNIADSGTPTSVVKKGQPNLATTTIPEGFVEYQNKELGFKFSYPKEWGNITVEDARFQPKPNSDIQEDKGKKWLLKFSNQSSASLGLASKDWSPAFGRGGSCSFADVNIYGTPPTYQDQESDIAIIKVIDRTDNYAIVENASVAMCQNLAFDINYIFKSNPTYAYLEFKYDSYQFKDENDFKVFKSSPDKYVKPELVKSIKQIAQTIQDL